jgi:hypothetical protein
MKSLNCNLFPLVKILRAKDNIYYKSQEGTFTDASSWCGGFAVLQ